MKAWIREVCWLLSQSFYLAIPVEFRFPKPLDIRFSSQAGTLSKLNWTGSQKWIWQFRFVHKVKWIHRFNNWHRSHIYWGNDWQMGGGIERMRGDNAIYAMPKPLWSNLNSEIIFYGPTMVQFNWDSRIDGLRQQWRWWVLFWWWRLPGSVPSIQDHLNFQSNLLPLFR